MIRQRASTKASQQTTSSSRVNTPTRKSDSSKASWEITSDDDDHCETSSAVPMYNPLHYDSNYHSKAPASPASFPDQWPKHQHDHHHSILGAPSSLSGLRELASLSHPAGIPDSSYQAYLMGRPLFKKKEQSFIDKICFAKFCAAFSWVAVTFLVFIAILLDRQAEFVKGVLPQHVENSEGGKAQFFYDISQQDRLEPASNAYKAAFAYFLTGVFSLAYAYNWGWWIKMRMLATGYHDIPDADSTVPTFHYNDGGDNPMMKAAYQYNNRLSARVWHGITTITNLIYINIANMWARNQHQQRARRRQMGAKEV